MKTLIFAIALSTIFFVACNNDGAKQETASATSETMNMNSNETVAENNSPIKGIVAGYLDVKNALAKDDDKAAADAANEMVKAFDGFDRKTLNPEQAKVFADIQTDAREHAEHIGSNTGNIEHQREHFETLSQEVYELAKATGAGQKLYYANCPMYNNNKGATWLSETKEISNPYFGKSMENCGSVTEELN